MDDQVKILIYFYVFSKDTVWIINMDNQYRLCYRITRVRFETICGVISEWKTATHAFAEVQSLATPNSAQHQYINTSFTKRLTCYKSKKCNVHYIQIQIIIFLN